MKVLITLHDVEPAVRLNARLEGDGIETVLVSPLDDIRAEIKRARPTLIVLTGELTDPATVALLREQLWTGVPVVGLDGDDPAQRERLRALGFVDLFPKPIVADDVADSLRRLMERRALQEATGLIGESEGLREVMVKVEQMAPVSSRPPVSTMTSGFCRRIVPGTSSTGDTRTVSTPSCSSIALRRTAGSTSVSVSRTFTTQPRAGQKTS